MLTTCINDKVIGAIKMSATIENSGQCTAMRHLVMPDDLSINENDFVELFSDIKVVNGPEESMQNGEFSNIINTSTFQLETENTGM